MTALQTTVVYIFVGLANSYETWHMVDVAQVVCPKPNAVPDAPPYPPYSVGINYTSSMIVDAPHIVSFMRTSRRSMTITFKIEDYYGDEVVPTTTVILQAQSGAIPSTCKCTNPTIPESVASTLGKGYGSVCAAWDEANCGEMWGNLTVGAWCCRPWCYASKDCLDAYESAAMPGHYFSYSACKASPVTSSCKWAEVAKQNDPCACQNYGSIFNAEMQRKFSLDYGAMCSTWDIFDCKENYRPDQVDIYCCKSWCYVDKKCSSAQPSINPGMEDKLFWSDHVCGDDHALVAQCPYKPESVISKDVDTYNSSACECLNVTMPSELLPAGVDPKYGQTCAPHDSEVCDVTYPGAKHDMWCCKSWCWVSDQCLSARASLVWPGKFWSDSQCELDAEIISSCKWNLTACQCTPRPASLPDRFSADYGSSCEAWDKDRCKAFWYHDNSSGWNTSDDHEWCCHSWCYVSGDCPIAIASWISSEYFSYEICDNENMTYNEAIDAWLAWPRRPKPGPHGPNLAGPPGPSDVLALDSFSEASDTCDAASDEENDNETSDEENDNQSDSNQTRRLGRGRGSSGGSRGSSGGSRGSSGGSRSRSPTPAYSGGSRRSPAPAPRPSPRPVPRPPSGNTMRRRLPGHGTQQAPSGLTSRRRSPPTPPAPDVRRRAPPPPVPAPMNTRRRTTSMNGQTYTAVARRRNPASISPRRRSAPPVPYGYSSRPEMMNNYGGQMPMQTQYGYSGANAYPAHKPTNVAMYAAGGLLAGAAVGAGGMYAYNQMYNGDLGSHRRRRYGNFAQPDWCIVNYRGSNRDGSFMECPQCQRMFGYASCQSASSCNTPAGCSYTTPSSFGRDDLAETGFVPKQFMPPLKVTFSKIQSDDIDPDPISGICPPTNAAEASLVEELNKTMSFKPDLFLVLTKQDTLQTLQTNNDREGVAVSGARAMSSDSLCSILLATLLALRAARSVL